jgi:hypothetical protein
MIRIPDMKNPAAAGFFLKDERGRGEPGFRRMCLRTFEPASVLHAGAGKPRGEGRTGLAGADNESVES